MNIMVRDFRISNETQWIQVDTPKLAACNFTMVSKLFGYVVNLYFDYFRLRDKIHTSVYGEKVCFSRATITEALQEEFLNT